MKSSPELVEEDAEEFVEESSLLELELSDSRISGGC